MVDPKDDNSGSPGSTLRTLAPLLTAGLQLAVAVILFFFLGRWIDQKLDSGPWMMLLFTLAGAGGGLYKFIRTAIDVGSDRPKDK